MKEFVTVVDKQTTYINQLAIIPISFAKPEVPATTSPVASTIAYQPAVFPLKKLQIPSLFKINGEQSPCSISLYGYV